MEFSFNVMVLFAALISLQLYMVSSLRCYDCNSSNQEDCKSIPEGSEKFLRNCTAPHDKTCRIQQQWVDFEVLNQTHPKRIIRQCAGTEYNVDKACYVRTGFGGKVSVCNCDTDGCNEASSHLASAVSVALGFLITLTVVL